MNQFPNKNYFTMPNEIFSLGLDASEIAVYAYLRCLENRSTYQCWPSYTTIGNAVGRAKNTVMRYVDALAEKGLVSIEPTSVLMKSGIKKNGNLLRRKQKPSNPNSKFFSLLLDAAITNREAYRYSVRTSNRAAQPSGAATRIMRIAVPKALCALRDSPRPRPKSGKVCRSDTRPGDVRERAVRVEGSDSGPVRKARVSPCKPLCAIFLGKPSVYPLSPVKANVGRL